MYEAKYLRKNTKQNKAFKAFVEAGGESLDMLAVYDALQSHLKGEGKEVGGGLYSQKSLKIITIQPSLNLSAPTNTK